MKKIRRIDIIGMGALGLMYGTLFSRNPDVEVCFVMDEARLAKCRARTFTCNGDAVEFRMSGPARPAPADLLLVAVKGTGLAQALETMGACIGPETVIISVMNGISSEEVIGDRYGAEKIVHAVAQGMDAMKFGGELTWSRTGELRIGIAEKGRRGNLEALEALLDACGMAFVEEDDIMHRLWSKLMMNVGVNQTCMVYGTTYGDVLAGGGANRTMIAAMREVIAVAQAEGVDLREKDLEQNLEVLGTLRPEGTPSMGQDRINRRRSEVELFAGTVRRLAARHGIPVPTNDFLYSRVAEIEAEYGD